MELGINIDKYLQNFKVHNSNSLFQPSAKEIHNSLKEKRCPLCKRKLRIDQKGNGRCGSKFNDKFFVKALTLKKYEKFERENR